MVAAILPTTNPTSTAIYKAIISLKAGNAIVQVGRRLWEDYWGPRMQAALLGLFRLAHVWNQHHPGARLGLLHVVFAAFNTEWRRNALAYLPPVLRITAVFGCFINALVPSSVAVVTH